ncbi:MAG: response regulator [Planctomycetes bacterium]|nr:response regulator [Planctomycetota bacterium]
MATTQQMSIWLIEDNEGDVGLFREAAQDAGLDALIDVMRDGTTAIERIAQVDAATVPDVIVFDLELPGASGREVLTAIKRHRLLADVPAILLTGAQRFETDPEHGHPFVPDEYLVKPGNWSQYWGLMDLIRDLIRLRRDPSLSSQPTEGLRRPHAAN